MNQTIHAEYTTVDVVVRDIIEYAKEHNLGVDLHVSETKSEHEECKGRKNGMTPVQYFDSVGLFDTRTVAAQKLGKTEELAELNKRALFGCSGRVRME